MDLKEKEKFRDEIKAGAVEILNDPEKMKEIIKEPGLVVALLKEMDELEIMVEIDGEPMYLVRSPEIPEKFKEFGKHRYPF